LKKSAIIVLTVTAILSLFYLSQNAQASPFFSNGYFTSNGIEWCEENLSLYKILGDKFFEHHNHSLESRICASLYHDYYWTYNGADRVEKLIERSRYYSQLEISESYEESITGIIDTKPAENKDQTLLQGITKDGEIIVQIISSTPKKNQTMEINLAFLDKYKKLVENVNYGVKITQQGEKILENSDIYSEKGLSTLITRPLNSEEPVLIKIFIDGIGIDDNQEELLDPRGDVIEFTVIPEFGTMTVTILGIIISLMILINAKNRSLLFRKND